MREASGTDLLSSGVDLGCIKEIHSALICDCHQPFSNLQEDVKVSRKSQMLYKPGKQLGLLRWSLRTWKSHRPVLFFSVCIKARKKKRRSNQPEDGKITPSLRPLLGTEGFPSVLRIPSHQEHSEAEGLVFLTLLGTPGLTTFSVALESL